MEQVCSTVFDTAFYAFQLVYRWGSCGLFGHHDGTILGQLLRNKLLFTIS